MLSYESLCNIVDTVIGEMRWTPWEVDKLYLDDDDYFGIEYWYNYVCELNEKLKPKPKPGT